MHFSGTMHFSVATPHIRSDSYKLAHLQRYSVMFQRLAPTPPKMLLVYGSTCLTPTKANVTWGGIICHWPYTHWYYLGWYNMSPVLQTLVLLGVV